MDLWRHLHNWLIRKAEAPAARLQSLTTDLAGELPCEPEKPWGCGWFDSSLDLQQGLAVIEHTAIDLALMQAVDRMLRPELANA